MFQVSDLAGSRRREFLDAAKSASASLRDTDGSVLTMVASEKIAALQEAGSAASMVFSAEAALARTKTPSAVELGGLAWLTEFDDEDRAEALTDIRNAVVVTVASYDATTLRKTLHEWITTANVLRDPLRRSVLTERSGAADFVEVAAVQTVAERHADAVAVSAERCRAANSELAAAVENRAEVLTAVHKAGLSWSRLGQLLGTTPQSALQASKPRDVRSVERAAKKPRIERLAPDIAAAGALQPGETA